MPVFLLAFLAPLLGKLPSLQAAKWIAGLVLFVAVGGLGFALGYHWEAAAFEKYKASAAQHELKLQRGYDAIGATVSKDYADKLAADLAETQRQLAELGNVQVRAPGKLTKLTPADRKLRNSPSSSNSDADRIVRVLRSAAGR